MTETDCRQSEKEIVAALLIGIAYWDCSLSEFVRKNIVLLHRRIGMPVLMILEFLLSGIELSHSYRPPECTIGEVNGTSLIASLAFSGSGNGLSDYWVMRLREYLTIAFENDRELLTWFQIGLEISAESSTGTQSNESRNPTGRSEAIARLVTKVRHQADGLDKLRQAAESMSTLSEDLRSCVRSIIIEDEILSTETSSDDYKELAVRTAESIWNGLTDDHRAIIRAIATLENKHPRNRITADQIARKMPEYQSDSTEKPVPSRLREQLSELRKNGVLMPNKKDGLGYRLSKRIQQPPLPEGLNSTPKRIGYNDRATLFDCEEEDVSPPLESPDGG